MEDAAGFERPRRLIVLGSGTSVGVPMIGCDCDVCASENPRTKRTRSSVLVELPQGNVLIDTLPEMRGNSREKIKIVHAIVHTDYHADHLFGLDDARLFPKYTNAPVPIYCEQDTEETIRGTFEYAFDRNSEIIPFGGLPKMLFKRIGPGRPFEILGQSILPIRLDHGRFRVLGFRFGDLAYCTDVNNIPDESWPLLRGLDTLVLDAFRP